MKFIQKRTGWWFLFTTLLCGVVFIPGIGKEVGGAYRWLNLGFGLGVQPSEFVKIALVLFVARFLSKREDNNLIEQKTMVLPFLLGQIPIVLVLLEPDLGSAVYLNWFWEP